MHSAKFVVGVTGLEPMASWPPVKRATKLRYTPMHRILYVVCLSLKAKLLFVWERARAVRRSCVTRRLQEPFRFFGIGVVFWPYLSQTKLRYTPIYVIPTLARRVVFFRSNMYCISKDWFWQVDCKICVIFFQEYSKNRRADAKKTRIALFLRHKIIQVATYPHRCVVFHARNKIKRVRFVFLPTQAVR